MGDDDLNPEPPVCDPLNEGGQGTTNQYITAQQQQQHQSLQEQESDTYEMAIQQTGAGRHYENVD